MKTPIGTKIKTLRLELGWSLRDLSKRMGYANQSTVARIESGEIDITQSKVVKFADVLGVSVAYLMGWEEEMEKNPVGLAERHIEILTDEQFVGMFDKFRSLDEKKRKIVIDLIDSL